MRIKLRRAIAPDGTTSSSEADAGSLRGPRLRGGGALARRRPRALVRAPAARAAPPADGRGRRTPLARAARRVLRRRGRRLRRRRARLRRGVLRRVRAGAARRRRAARSSPTASSPHSRARPGAARAAGTFCARNHLAPFVPCHRVVAADGIGSFGVARDRLQAPPAGARGCPSLTTCATSSPRSRPRAAAAGSPSSRRSATPPGAWHLRGHGELAVHLDLASAAAARRAFTLLRDVRRALGDPHLPPARVRPGDALPAPRRRRRARRRGVPRGGGALRTGRAARAPAEARRRPFVLPRRLPARGAPRAAARSRARATRTSSCARAGREGAELLAAIAAREGVELASTERRNHAVAYAKAGETIADLLALAGASETALRLDEHAVVAAISVGGEPARERRRGEREADGQRRPAAAGGDPRTRPRGASGQARRRSQRCGSNIRPTRWASSPGAAVPPITQGRRASPDDRADPAGAAAGSARATARPRRLTADSPPQLVARGEAGGSAEWRRGSSEDETPPCRIDARDLAPDGV